MPGDPVEIRSGDVGLPHPPHLLGKIEYGGSRGRLIWRGIPKFSGGDSGGPAVPNYFQCGFGHSGAPMVIDGGRGRGGSRTVGEGGDTLHCVILRG